MKILRRGKVDLTINSGEKVHFFSQRNVDENKNGMSLHALQIGKNVNVYIKKEDVLHTVEGVFTLGTTWENNLIISNIKMVF